MKARKHTTHALLKHPRYPPIGDRLRPMLLQREKKLLSLCDVAVKLCQPCAQIWIFAWYLPHGSSIIIVIVIIIIIIVIIIIISTWQTFVVQSPSYMFMFCKGNQLVQITI